jgi:hypothetical protein
MRFTVKEVPLSWINRAADMGVSSFHLAKAGHGCWRALTRLTIETRFGFRRLQRKGRYSEVTLEHDASHV